MIKGLFVEMGLGVLANQGTFIWFTPLTHAWVPKNYLYQLSFSNCFQIQDKFVSLKFICPQQLLCLV